MTVSADYIRSDELIESGHPGILQKADQLSESSARDVERAEKIFYFIRDSIRYTFIPRFDSDDYRASSILKSSRGFCTQKAILFCALARCAGIPAGIHFYDIVDKSLPDETVAMMKTSTFYRHGIAELYLDGIWRQYDATLDSALVERNGLRPVEFDAGADCLMHEATLDGSPHITYVKDHGRVSRVTFDEIMGWFRLYYPHLHPDHLKWRH
jgi:transglutaminase-like putative cysteine protease